MRNKVAAAAEAAAAALGGAASAPPTHGGSKTVDKIQSIAAGAPRRRRVFDALGFPSLDVQTPRAANRERPVQVPQKVCLPAQGGFA